ncbi:unnamed protein product [Sympodiomycopsis kandeliae]
MVPAFLPEQGEAGPSRQRLSLAKGTGERRRNVRRSNDRRGSSWSDDRQYAVLVDAGSSGSRLQVYSWKDPVATSRRLGKLKQLPKVEKGVQDGTNAEWQWKVEPGLSSFASHSQDLPGYLGPLFDHAKSIIPSDKLSSTPVYVMATAGMRLIPESQQKDIIRRTCDFIRKDTPFAIDQCQDHVQIISGEQEGLLGWIAINYLMDGFHFNSDAAAADTQGKSTFGFLDMGGASTQIAFEPSANALAASNGNADDLTQVTLRLLDGTQVTHNVFVTTFLGFGTNKARERYEADLLKHQDLQSDPCLPIGATTPALNTSNILGSGSFTSCLKALTPLLDKSAPCLQPPCLFHGIHVPPIDFSMNHFIGVSEYWFSSNDLFNLGGIYDYYSFQKASQEFCSQPWSDLKSNFDAKKYSTQIDINRLKLQCFKSAWMTTILHDGIGLPRVIDKQQQDQHSGTDHVDEIQNKLQSSFQSVNEINGTTVSWTLGKAVLEATKAIPPKSSFVSPLMLFIGASLVLIAGLLAFVTRGSSPAARRRRKVVWQFVKNPCCSSRTKPTAHGGEYALSDMEEGYDEDKDDERHGLLNGSNRHEGVNDEDDESGADDEDQDDDHPQGGIHGGSTPQRGPNGDVAAGTGRHSSTSSRSSWLSYLPLSARRWILSTSAHLPGTRSSTKRLGRGQRSRRTVAPRVVVDDGQPSSQQVADLEPPAPLHEDLRRAVSSQSMRDSRAASPSLAGLPSSLMASSAHNVISRPVSRNNNPRISRPSSRNANDLSSSGRLLSPAAHPQLGSYFAEAQSRPPLLAWTSSSSAVSTHGTNTPQKDSSHAALPFSMQSISHAIDVNANRKNGHGHHHGINAYSNANPSGFLTPQRLVKNKSG